MLVLTRKLGESIIIENEIRVTVTYIGESSVKLGIDAPPNVLVHRLEVHDRVK